jgi:hypothetical protein
MSVKLATQKQLRQYNVSNVIASARIEGITLSEQFQKNLADYVCGKKSIAEMLKVAKKRYATNPVK